MKYQSLVVVGVAMVGMLAGCDDPNPIGCRDLEDAFTPPAGSRFVPIDQEVSYAVVNTDFQSTSISLLDASGLMIADDWYDSGTFDPGSVATLSGDVGLPSSPSADGALVVIDRQGVNVLTSIDIVGAKILCQVSTQDAAPGGEPALNSNPQDVAYLDNSLAWVSRFNVNTIGTGSNRGSDLLEVNLADFTRTGVRVDLSTLDEEEPISESETTHTYARPSSAVRVGDYVVAGLLRGSANLFAENSTLSDGAMAIVSISDRSVQSVEFSDLKNCVQVSRVPGSASKVMLACIGWPFNSRDNAGIVVVDIAAAPGSRVLRSCHLGEEESLPAAMNQIVPLSETEVVATAYGELVFDEEFNVIGGTPDRLHKIDLSNCTATAVGASAGPFELGQGVYNVATHTLIVPDAVQFDPWEAVQDDIDRVRRFNLSTTPVATELASVNIGVATRLSPRLIGPVK